MGVTFWRWTAGVALGCGALAVVLLPFPPVVPQTWTSAAPPQLAAEIRKLTEAAGDAQAAVRTYRSAQALDRWSDAARRGDSTLVRVDPSVPALIASVVRDLAGQQWASLGTKASAAHAEIFVFFDSTLISRSGDSTSRRVLESQRLVDVSFALPPATDGERCVALVRLRGTSAAHVAALRGQSLIGVCGFYAAFGMPGAGVRNWLTATGHRFARRSDWSKARAPATDASSLYTLSESAARCLTGNAGACKAAIQVTDSGSNSTRKAAARASWVLDAALALSGNPTRRLGDAEPELLADVVRFVGPLRFARFWQSGSAPDEAFLTASGVRLHEWTHQWLARTYGQIPERPSARPRDLVWLAILAPIGLVLAARPRQRVLAERWFVRS